VDSPRLAVLSFLGQGRSVEGALVNRIGAAMVVVGTVAGCDELSGKVELTPDEAAACSRAGFGGMAIGPTMGNPDLDDRCSRWAAQQRAARNESKGRDARSADDFGR
jgi:hypothetical protein